MHTAQPNLFTRSDTLLGICEGLGEDFGFNPNYLRVLLGVGLLWNPVAMVGIYLGLGLLVAATRWLIPARRAQRNAAPVEMEIRTHQNDDCATVLAEAA